MNLDTYKIFSESTWEAWDSPSNCVYCLQIWTYFAYPSLSNPPLVGLSGGGTVHMSDDEYGQYRLFEIAERAPLSSTANLVSKGKPTARVSTFSQTEWLFLVLWITWLILKVYYPLSLQKLTNKPSLWVMVRLPLLRNVIHSHNLILYSLYSIFYIQFIMSAKSLNAWVRVSFCVGLSDF